MSNKMAELPRLSGAIVAFSCRASHSLPSISGLLATLLCCLALPVAANSSPEAVALLEKMASSFRALNYDGVYVHQNGKAMSSARIVHVVVDGKEHERTVQLTGTEQEIVRAGHDVRCVHPGDERLRSIDTHSAHVFGNYQLQPSKILPHYSLEVVGKDRVAGREVDLVQVTPLDEQRYQYRLYVDTDSGLLLKSETLGGENQALESFQFTQLSIGADVDVEAVKPTTKSAQRAKYHVVKQLQQSAEPSQGVNWRANWLPDGFLMVASGDRQLETEAMQTFLYTDGLASVSVFIEAADSDANTKGNATPEMEPQTTRLGSTVAFVMPRRLASKTFLVSVIGNVPGGTAQRIAENVAAVAAK